MKITIAKRREKDALMFITQSFYFLCGWRNSIGSILSKTKIDFLEITVPTFILGHV